MIVVYVEWMDSMMLNYGDWMDTADVEEPMTKEGMRHLSVGFLVSEGEHAICIASNINGDGTRCAGTAVIPKVAITSMTKEEYGAQEDRPNARTG